MKSQDPVVGADRRQPLRQSLEAEEEAHSLQSKRRLGGVNLQILVREDLGLVGTEAPPLLRNLTA